MPLTAIFLFPPTQPSQLPTILSHIPLNFACSSLPSFSLNHHLFASTSSLLPGSQPPWPPTAYERPLLSVLTLSPSWSTRPTTFVLTSHPQTLPSSVENPGPVPAYEEPNAKGNNKEKIEELLRLADEKYRSDTDKYEKKVAKSTATALALLKYNTTSITISPSDSGAFLELVTTKMQPLWSIRGTERLDNGLAISLRDGEWTLRLGELRQETRKAGIASGTSRGIVCEVTWMEAQSKETGDAVPKAERDMMTAFLQQVLEGTGTKIDGARNVAGHTPVLAVDQEGAGGEYTTNWALAELYAELLRTRG